MAPKLRVLIFICCYRLKIGGFHTVIKNLATLGSSALVAALSCSWVGTVPREEGFSTLGAPSAPHRSLLLPAWLCGHFSSQSLPLRIVRILVWGLQHGSGCSVTFIHSLISVY